MVGDKRLSALVQLSQEGILVVSDAGRILFANTAAEELLGYATEQSIGELFGFPAATDSPTIVMVRRKKQGTARIEMRATETVWDGETAYVINLHDVTNLSNAFDNAQHLAAIVESSDDAIYRKELNGIVSSWNKGAERIFGYSAEEMVGSNIDTLIPVGMENDEPALLGKVKAGEAVGQYETKRQTKSGEVLDISLTLSPVHDASGEVIGASSIARDITDAKLQHEALLQRTYNLRERVKEQSCMYACSKKANAAEDMADLIQFVAKTIPSGFQFPAKTSAHIKLDDDDALCDDYHESGSRLSEKIIIEGEERGRIEVYCRESENVTADETPYLPEEVNLVKGVADILAQACNRIEHHQQNIRLNKVLRAIQGINQLIVQENDQEKLISRASELLVESKAFSACWLALVEDKGIIDHAHTGIAEEDLSILIDHFDSDHVSCCLKDRPGKICTGESDQGIPLPDCPLREIASDKTVISARLQHDDKIFGIIAVFINEYTDNDMEVALLEEVADDLSMALHHIEMRKKVLEVTQQHADILASINDGFFALDDELTLTYFNTAAEKILGCSADEVIGKYLFDVFPEAAGSIFEERYSRAIKTKEPDHFEIYYDVKPYENWWDVNIYPQTNGITVYFQVTTEQKEAEIKLERSLELLNETGDLARIGGWDVDLVTNKVFWTKTTRSIHEVDDDFEPTVEEALSFYPPEVRPVITKAVERACEEGIPYDLEIPFVTAKGNRLLARAVGKPEMKDGKCIRLHGIFQDITEKKEAEDALREAKLKLEAAIKAGQIGLWDWNTNTNEVEFSSVWKQHLGYEDHEIKHDFDEWQQRVHPDDLKHALDRISKMLNSKNPSYKVEFRMQHKDGSYRHILSQASIVEIVDGKPSRIMGSHTDITDLRKAEQEHLRLTEELQQVQKMESVGRLAGGVAHDFNNKLSIIIGYTQLAMMNMNSDDPLYSRLEQIYKAGESSAALTRQLLAFARKQTIDPQVVELNELIAGMLKMLGRLIGEDIDLAWQPHQGLWLIKIDPGQVDQILANLAVNARDAIDGNGSITIKTKNTQLDKQACQRIPDAVPGDYVVISITDTGCGIGDETLNSIFEPFFTTKEQGKGTGLGLSTVYGIVQQNNGFITVDSKRGDGTTFSIYIPRLEGDEDIFADEVETVDIPTGTETLLVVEDEAAMLTLTTVILEEGGYTVLACSKPEDALKVAREHAGEIDLIITDVVMPGMNGRELQTKIREILPDARFLFMSGYTADIIAKRGVLEKDVHFIEKPFQASELCQKIRGILDS